MTRLDYLQRLPRCLRAIGSAEQCEYEIIEPPNDSYGIVYEDDYTMLVKDYVRHPGGRESSYARVVGKGEVAGTCGSVLVPVIDDAVVFIEVYRHATRCWHWELPRGFQKPELTAEENAKEELKEELSVEPTSIELIPPGIHANTGMLSGRADVFLVRISPDSLPNLQVQRDEAIRAYRLVRLAELPVFVKDHVTCGFSLSAIYLTQISGRL